MVCKTLQKHPHPTGKGWRLTPTTRPAKPAWRTQRMLTQVDRNVCFTIMFVYLIVLFWPNTHLEVFCETLGTRDIGVCLFSVTLVLHELQCSELASNPLECIIEVMFVLLVVRAPAFTRLGLSIKDFVHHALCTAVRCSF